MIVDSISLLEPYRAFPDGYTVNLNDRVTVIVGDNGSGKSTLLGLIRARLNSAWTPSTLQVKANIISMSPEPDPDEPVNYVDLAADHMGFRTEFDTENFEAHVRALHKSAGQASILQLSNSLKASKARLHIIDEPERGLSPSKQWVLGALLKDAVEHRSDDQFIVSTHSEHVMEALGGKVMQMPTGASIDYKDYLANANLYGCDQAERYLEALRAERTEGTFDL